MQIVHTLTREAVEKKEQVLLRAISTYGMPNQMAMAQEEVAELIEALSIMRRDAHAGFPMVIEEIADVRIMLRQIEMMLDAQDEIQACASVQELPGSLACEPGEVLAGLIQAISKLLRGKRSGRSRVIERAGQVTALIGYFTDTMEIETQVARIEKYKIRRLVSKIERFKAEKAA